jgi:hypothetical protein
LIEALSGNHDVATVDMIDSLNRQLVGWAAFYKFTDFTARTFRRIDTVVFWKMAHWLARKYRSRIKPLMRKWYRVPETGQSKTWLIYGRSNRGKAVGKAAQTGHQPENAVPVAEPGSKSLHLQGRNPKYRYLPLS